MDALSAATELREQGTQKLLEGDVFEAIELFERSIAAQPTAESYTFHGWAISTLGRLDEAMEDCRRAIRLDPEFGNPYNDIGVYLMRQGQLDHAIPWFEHAKKSKRYEPRHFPYLNLGRVYLAKGDSMRAIDEFVAALEVNPGDPVATAALNSINYSVN